MALQCEGCQGDTRRVVLFGKELLCPSCYNARRDLPRITSAVFRDEIPGGVTLDNYGPTPVTFYSHGERRAYMARHGLQERERFAPMPGTDKDPQGIPNPAGYMDPYTLNNARILVSRQAETSPKLDDSIEGVLRGEFSGALSEKEAQAFEDGDVRKLSRLHRRTHGPV